MAKAVRDSNLLNSATDIESAGKSGRFCRNRGLLLRIKDKRSVDLLSPDGGIILLWTLIGICRDF